MYMLHVRAVAVLLVAFLPIGAKAQDACGKPPEFSLSKEETEKVQGDLKGAATFLKGYVGQADLGGKIESERKKIYQTDSTITAQQKDAYLYYVTCALLWNDRAMTTPQKLEELRKMRESFQKGVSKLENFPPNICDEREGAKCGAFLRESKVCFQSDRVVSFMTAETIECTLSIFSRSQIVSAGWNLQKLATFKSELIKKDAPCIELAASGVSISELRTKIACQ